MINFPTTSMVGSPAHATPHISPDGRVGFFFSVLFMVDSIFFYLKSVFTNGYENFVRGCNGRN